MKRIHWLIVVGLLTWAGPRMQCSAAAAQLHLHFVGAEAIQNHRQALVLRDISKLEEGAAVFELITRQLAGNWSAQLGIAPTAATNQLAAAIGDILRSEIHFELLNPSAGRWRLAAKLDGRNAKSVQKTIQDFVRGARSVVELQVDANGSWRFTPLQKKPTTHVSYQRGWLVIDSSGDAQPSAWRQQLTKEGKLDLPTGAIGALTGRSEFLKGYLPRLQRGNPFAVSLTVNVRKGTPRIEGAIEFAKPVALQLEKFELPSKTLRDPLISFLVARGTSGLFSRQPELKEWRLPSYPNQVVAWTEADKPVYSSLAVRLPGAGRWFNKQIPRFEESLGLVLETKRLGTMRYLTNYSAMVWQGLPMIAPFIGTNALDPDWIFSATFPGFLPQGPITNPPPANLISQIRNRPDLIYYHWEVTEPRVQQMQLITSLSGFLLLKRNPLPGNPFPKWLKAMQERLGNTITEVTRESDRRWEIVRSGTIGLTASELTILAQWLTPWMPMPDLLPPGLTPK